MDEENLRELRRRAPPEPRASIRLLMDYAPAAVSRAVPDPYYGGADGFALIERVLAGAAAHLSPGGWLLVEVGLGQADEAVRRLRLVGGFTPDATLKDGDGIPRVIVARRET